MDSSTTKTEIKSALTHTLKLVRSRVSPLHPMGTPFVAFPLAVTLLGRRHRWIRRAGLLGGGIAALFFRNPHRVPPNRSSIAVAPADGEIISVDPATPPPELGLGTLPLPRVSIVISPWDVHVQRVPITGEVQSVVHQSGQFLPADSVDASTANERNSMLIRASNDQDVAVVQIASLLTRRIICHAKPGDMVVIGETYGLIFFGSRVDIYFPSDTSVLVERGQRAIGGETVLAQLK